MCKQNTYTLANKHHTKSWGLQWLHPKRLLPQPLACDPQAARHADACMMACLMPWSVYSKWIRVCKLASICGAWELLWIFCGSRAALDCWIQVISKQAALLMAHSSDNLLILRASKHRSTMNQLQQLSGPFTVVHIIINSMPKKTWSWSTLTRWACCSRSIRIHCYANCVMHCLHSYVQTIGGPSVVQLGSTFCQRYRLISC